MSIYNPYQKKPDGLKSLVNLYPSIFNSIFNDNLPFLDDNIYLSWQILNKPYEFFDIKKIKNPSPGNGLPDIILELK